MSAIPRHVDGEGYSAKRQGVRPVPTETIYCLCGARQDTDMQESHKATFIVSHSVSLVSEEKAQSEAGNGLKRYGRSVVRGNKPHAPSTVL